MKTKHLIKIAFSGLTGNKRRAALTILGIVIGITAIMLIMSLGQGAQNLILSQVQNMGAKIIIVQPGRQPSGPSDIAQSMSDSLKEKDLIALQKKSNVPTLAKIEALNVGGATASYENETYRMSIFGASELLQKIYNVQLTEGRFITDDDVKNRADVVVIGSKIKQELFGESDAVGEKIKIKSRNFRVVGIVKKGQSGFVNFDEAAIVPYTTSQQYIFGIKHFHHLLIEATSEDVVEQTLQDVQITLRNSHGITDPEKDDFYATTSESAIDQINTITTILTLFLVSVAAISLVVGGIGIMNIMLVSVAERTREIGLRKALGATSMNILLQFLAESIMLTAIGGAVGIFLGSSISFLTTIILTQFLGLDWPFSFPLSAALIGLAVAAFVGLVFGIYPAKQAAKKSPIEALRYE
ncbi:ABC transporter permease [Patescibacteria group bacterium]|nr:ABC transporter permease [Patescibacteria group bacterium]